MKGIISDIGFIEEQEKTSETVLISKEKKEQLGKKIYIESYGCQMNFSDSEIVSSIMEKEGYTITNDINNASIAFINTCSIREKAELTIRKRLEFFNLLKHQKSGFKVGVLGCMAERLKEKLLEEEKIVDLVVGPDAYRDLPNLIKDIESGQKAINTFLSREETYADISPVRLNTNGVSAFISIMRGCDNMCSFCVVPFTRGRERSRDPYSIVAEAQDLFNKGYKEVYLLGQNVDSYKWSVEQNNKAKLEKSNIKDIINFSKLLTMVADIHPDLRVRFSTSHPKDMTDEILYIIKKYDNICNYIHLPAQSGNSRILKLMNRTYDRAWYIDRIDTIKKILGEECGISSDIITGFCSETEEEHQDTLSLMEYVKYDNIYMYYYSERPGTLAKKKYKDDISLYVKKRRLSEVIEKQQTYALERNKPNIGKTFKVLIERYSKRSKEHFQGRNSANKVVIFPTGKAKKGDYVHVKIEDCNTATLFGKIVGR